MKLPKAGLALFFLFCVVVLAARGTAPRIGDGDEYAGMVFALLSGHPYMTPESIQAFDAHARLHPETGYSVEYFNLSSIKLYAQADGSHDFPHFWFLSLLTVPLAAPILAVGANINYAFTTLHLLLLGASLLVARRLFGARGVIAAIVILICSPALWYINKAHSEYYTVSLTLIAVMLVLRQRWLWAALPFAALTTQNPPFGILFALAGLLALFTEGRFLRSPKGLAIAVTANVLALSHPAYYLYRLGVITPQLLNDGLSKETPNLHRILAVFIDPDIGLFAGWPPSILILLWCSYLLWRKRRSISFAPFPVLFFLVYVVVMAYSHSKTSNLNSGATIGMSRYALWYLPWIFAPLYFCLKWMEELQPVPRWATMGFLAIVFFPEVRLSWSTKYQNYCTPSKISAWLYSRFPRLYDPELEIFIERYSGYCESALPKTVWAVANPHCTKLVVLDSEVPPEPPGPSSSDATLVLGCRSRSLDRRLLLDYAKVSEGQQRPGRFMVNLSPKLAESLSVLPRFPLGQTVRFGVRDEPSKQSFLGSGWSTIEENGVWTLGRTAEILFSFGEEPPESPAWIELEARGLVTAKHPKVQIALSLNETPLGHLDLESMEIRRFALEVPKGAWQEQNRLRFRIANPISPKELGLPGNDDRKLGLWLASLNITPKT
jgi:hypothetical protein